MAQPKDFEPSWFSPPGRTIARKMAEANWSLDDFAWQMELTPEGASDLLESKIEISDRIASRLEQVLGVSALFWKRREAHFRGDCNRLAETISLDQARNWLRKLPHNELASLGWINKKDRPTDKVAECLRFYEVPSPDVWEKQLQDLTNRVQLKTSASFLSDKAALGAWLRKGELEAEKMLTSSWDREKFEALLPTIKKLTRIRRPKTFVPKLQKLCASAGVAVVIARAPKGCRASGATRFLSANKALLLLSFRHRSEDHFWFAFFHEAGHLLLHDNTAVFVEGEELRDKCESEANDFARDLLVPRDIQKKIADSPLSEKRIVRFAIQAETSPGIIVGQLQHSGRVSHNYFNYLKRRYSLDDISL